MECTMQTVTIIIAIAFGAPPHLIDSRSTLQRYADAGIQTQGRDPFAATEICGAPLPVHCPEDVYYDSLPERGFDDDHLRLLRRFPNLTQVRCRRTITDAEHCLIDSSVPRGTVFLYNVCLDDGTNRKGRTLHGGYTKPVKDINGDGVVDEDDEEIAGTRKGG